MSNQPKLSNEAKKDLCRLLAHYTPPSQIVEHIFSYYGVEISQANVNYYSSSKKWGILIETFRTLFLNNIKEIPMSFKEVRMARLESLYNSAVTAGDYTTAIRILRQAQQEMEGIKISLGKGEISPINNYDNDEELESMLSEAGVKIEFKI